MAIRFLYFDLGNVLLNFSHRRAAEQIAAVAGVSADLVWQLLFEEGLELRYESGELTDEEMYEEFCARTGTRPDLAALRRAGCEIFDVNAPMLPLLAQLRAGGYRMGILSNTCTAHWEHCTARYRFLKPTFDVHALSFELGCCKPERQIFERATELAGVEPGEIFFTDDLEPHIAAAQSAGWQAAHFTGVATLAAQLRAQGVRCNY